MTKTAQPPAHYPVKISGYNVHLKRTAKEASAFYGLSARETEFLDNITRGYNAVEAAERMGVSKNTAITYKTRCIQKMNVKSITTAAALFTAYCSGAEITTVEEA